MNGWIAVDLDGTLAAYDGWQGVEHIGEPIAPMVEKVKRWLTEGQDVRIFTARVYPLGTLAENDPEAGGRVKDSTHAANVIEDWCLKHIGKVLPLTCIKDYGMLQLWDDRAVQVIPNTGNRADGKEI